MVKKKRSRNNCCKIFIRTIKSIGIKMYDLCNSNKYVVCNYISKSKKFCCKSFSGNGNTCINRLVKYLTDEFIKKATRSMVPNPLDISRNVLGKSD
ncbi:conserved hypothetical protein [Magpiepox virus]|nr:conserved hypothetical protein [Magpiepox virus]